MPFPYACTRCGETVMKPSRSIYRRVYCSRACFFADKATVPVRPCRACGQDFRPRGGSDRPYCSRACYESTRTPPVTKTCGVCGKDFTVKAAVAHRYTVCSAACKTATTVYVNCGRCGKRFANTDPKRLNRHYCSEECRRPPMILTCRNCGEEFREVPSMAARQFCSFSCYRSFAGETRLEARVRVALELLGVDFTRQFPVRRWSIDFAILPVRVAIEADGDYWHKLSAARDARRDAHLERAGWRVVRLSESDVDAARDLPDFILGRIRDVTGLERGDLPSARPDDAAPSPVPSATRAFRLKRPPGPVRGQIPLWGETA